MSRALRRVLASVISAMTLTAALVAGAGVATAASSTPDVLAPLAVATSEPVITLGAVTPSVASSGRSVTITGVLTASASKALPAGTLRVARGTATLAARTDIDAWAADTSPAAGATFGSIDVRPLAAGASEGFAITLPRGTVRSDRAFESIPVSLELSPAGAGPVAVTHTFLAWLGPRKEYEALSLAMLVPVALDPDIDLFSRDVATKERAWQQAIGAGSRIRTIVEGTRGTPVTLVVDPTVVGPDAADRPGAPTGPSPGQTGTPAPTSAPTSGPTGQQLTQPPAGPPSSGASPTGTSTIAGPELPAGATQLADELAAQLRGRSMWAMPYADADLAATVDTDPGNPLVRDLVDRSASLGTRLGQPVRTDVAWPVDELLPTGREAALARLYSGNTAGALAGIVVAQGAITATSPYTPSARRVGAGGTRLLGVDSRLSQLLPTGREAAGLSTQRFLAETLALLGERPGTPRSVLVAAPRTWSPDPAALAMFLAATDVPWLTRVDAATLLTDSAREPAVRQQAPVTPPVMPPIAVPPAVLTSSRLEQLARQRDTILDVSTVLRDPESFERIYRELLDELASVRWRYAPGAWTQLAAAVDAEVRSATSAIEVIPRGVNFLAESGILQVTVRNGLDYEIGDVRLVLSPTNPRMQIVEQPGPITIGAGSLTTVRVPVIAVAAGEADIRATLTTADGTPIGRGAVIPVAANPLDAQIYWIGGIAVGLILIAGVLRTILRGTSRIDEIGELPADLHGYPATSPAKNSAGDPPGLPSATSRHAPPDGPEDGIEGRSP